MRFKEICDEEVENSLVDFRPIGIGIVPDGLRRG
jgi:hypothetical protein